MRIKKWLRSTFRKSGSRLEKRQASRKKKKKPKQKATENYAELPWR